jgi:hypothetical protein
MFGLVMMADASRGRYAVYTGNGRFSLLDLQRSVALLPGLSVEGDFHIAGATNVRVGLSMVSAIVRFSSVGREAAQRWAGQRVKLTAVGRRDYAELT